MARAFSKKIRGSLATQWNCEISHNSHLTSILKAVFEDVNSPKTLALSLCLENSHDELLELTSLTPDSYPDWKSYALDNLACTLVKKYPKWDTLKDPKREAMKTFISCEIECMNTNNRLRANRRRYVDDAVSDILHIARRKIARILGPVPAISSLPFEFGPGATLLVKGRTTVLDKLDGALNVTPKSIEPSIEYLGSVPGWLSLHGVKTSDTDRIRDCLTISRGDRLSFVPKTAKTDRPIAIGPTVNVLLQKGYGSIIRSRLKRSGLNLNRCPDRHISLARRASLDNSLATIDLKSASDTISYEAVRELLPVKWFEALAAVRSEEYTIEGKWYPYHKFSAMGNGYTFELESLIFYALAKATCEKYDLSYRDVTVFGDDIILPTDGAEPLMSSLHYLGFSVNKEKTFVNSNFRESCGGDFYKGISVRGFYIKKLLKLRDIVRFRNYLYRTGLRYYLNRTWRLLRAILKPFESYLAGPDDLTDDHIIFDDYSHLKPFNFVSEIGRAHV